ncbi:MAG: HAD family hydrolase [Acidobacteria bacterium]|nr:HAD family hydrolase [Acidobacteriota bacterium]
MTPAVFLDRDGTLIEEVHYLGSPEGVRLFPWSIEAVRALNQAKLPVVLVTNQSGVARGFFPEAAVEAVHHHIRDLLASGGARLDGYYYCPHHPDGTVGEYATACDCRKPGGGLVRRAASDLGLDPARSYCIGDSWADVGLARAIGATGLLVKTGHGAAMLARPPAGLTPDAVVDNVIEAVGWILHRRSCETEKR